MDLKIIANIITIVLTAAVAGFVYGRNPGSKVTRSFLMLITSFILWAIAHVILYSGFSQHTFLIERAAYVLGLIIAWAFLACSYSFPLASHKIKKPFILFGILLNIVVLAFIFTPSGIITGIYFSPPRSSFILNTLFFIFYAFSFFYSFSLAYYLLFKKYRNLGGESRILVRYFTLFSLVPVIAGAIANIIFFHLGFSQYQIYGPVFTLVFTLGVAYLLMRSDRP